MSGEDDLKANLAANSAAITDALTAIENKVAEIVASATGDSDADIETLAQELGAQTAQFKLGVSNALTPAPKVAPGTGGAAAPAGANTTTNQPAPGAGPAA